MGEKLPRILLKVATSTSLLGSFTCRKFKTWDLRLYFPSEGWHAEDFLKASLTSETTRANTSSGRWKYGREIAENFSESGDFHVTFGFFYMP